MPTQAVTLARRTLRKHAAGAPEATYRGVPAHHLGRFDLLRLCSVAVMELRKAEKERFASRLRLFDALDGDLPITETTP